MLIVSAIAGNIYSDSSLAKRWRRAETTGSSERLLVSRLDMDKVRMRRKTDRGTEVGLVLERGSRLRHGDILDVGRKLIMVEQLPEKIISIAIGKRKTSQAVETAALVGHAIGNRHRSISIEEGEISFPIQNDSELHVFEKLMPKGVKMRTSTQIFVPSGEVHHHE